MVDGGWWWWGADVGVCVCNVIIISNPTAFKVDLVVLSLGEHSQKKMSQIVGKVHNFLDPHPQDYLDYFEFGKK